MHRLSNPPKGPRGASPSLRPGGGARGGIQKRGRTSSPRVDRDGDLAMDADAAKARAGRGRFDSPKPSLADRTSGQTSIRGAAGRAGSRLSSSRTQAAIIRGLEGKQANVRSSPRGNRQSASLRVYGLAQSKAAANADGGLKRLIDFIERKASTKTTRKGGIRITKSQITGDSTVIITASAEDIITIRILEGFEFAGAALSFKPEGPTAEEVLESSGNPSGTSSETQELKDRLRAILADRYNAETKLLNLSNLANDTGLKEMGMFDGTTTPSKIFPALMAICDGLFKTRKAKIEAVESVTLADNGLVTIKDVFQLAATFPDLKNLDLSRNAIASLESIERWKHKFRGLVNVLLAGNPIEEQLPVVKDDLLQWFPNLQVINGVQLRSAEDIAAAKEAMKNLPLPIPIGPPDFRDVSQVGEGFVRQFLPLYDSDRQSLLTTFYDSESRLSISVNMTAPRDKVNGGPIPSWGPYTKHSRNLTKITHLPSRMTRQHKGVQDIQKLWTELPATRHPDLATEFHKYTIECNPIPGLVDPTGASPAGVDGLMLTIHGEFEEPNPTPEKPMEKAMRSFSRTFIIGPGVSQPIRIISDMLVLRPWSPLAQPAAEQPSAQPQQVAGGNGPTEQQIQEAMALQLMEKTGMTLQYAALCLQETGWDLEKAFMAFTANRANLPAEAFTAV